MSVKRYAARRDDNESLIVEALIYAGSSVTRLSMPGVADLLVGRLGVNYLIEVKNGNAKLTPVEQRWHDEWQGQIAIARNMDEVLRIVGAIE